MMTRPIALSRGISYMISSMYSSRIERRARAPVSFFMAFSAISSSLATGGINWMSVGMFLLCGGICAYTYFFHDRILTEYEYTFTNGALDFADYRQTELLNRYIATINEPRPAKLPQWRMMPLKALQFIIPFLLLLAACYPFIRQYNFNRYMKKQETITYFQKVNLNSGGGAVR